MSMTGPDLQRSAQRPHLVCFGELLVRLTAPGHQFLLQSPRMDIHFGGAEANVAIGLARFGHSARMVSVVADNALGEAVVGELRRSGVDTTFVRNAAGRMGLYFLQVGAMQRPSDVLYDRAGSAFALADPAGFDWPRMLAGAGFLHLSGVTPALGAQPAAATIDAARAARTLGVQVVFDGNYRAKLWGVSNGDAPTILRRIIDNVDILFADQRDIALILGLDFGGLAADAAQQEATKAAFAAFPQLKLVASLRRHARTADRQQLAAVIYDRSQKYCAGDYALDGIVDRIGAGDAFVAGTLHGLLSGRDAEHAMRFGLAAACLKHSVPGDYIRFGVADVEALLREERVDVRR